jgi:hypothetical protein
MITATVNELLAAWSEHQITARELVTESRQLTAEQRAQLRDALQSSPLATSRTSAVSKASASERQVH